MRATFVKAAALAALLLSPGCASPEEPAPGEPPLPEVGAAGTFVFNECTGFAVVVEWPPGQNPGAVPPGWGEAPGVTTSFLWALTCGRARIGPYERPLDWIMEAHNFAQPPDGCRQVAIAASVLHWLATSDPEVSAWLANETGIPVATATVAMARASAPDRHEVRVEADGGPLLEGQAVEHGLRGPDPRTTSAFYPRADGGLQQLNITLGMGGTTGPALPFSGSARPPLLASRSTDPFAGTALALNLGEAGWEAVQHARADCR